MTKVINSYGPMVELVDTRESQMKWVPPYSSMIEYVKNSANSHERVNLGAS